MDTERIRKSFKPERIKFLFVGESPPAGGTFFYTGSRMTIFTKRAFEAVFDRSFDGISDFLLFFQDQGCYLEDLTEIPVDKTMKAEREKILAKSVKSFSTRLKWLQPEVIVSALKKISPHVKEAARLAGLSCPIYVLPFAGQGTQNEYTQGLCKILKAHL